MFNPSLPVFFILNGRSGSGDPATASDAIKRIAVERNAVANIQVVYQGSDIGFEVRAALRSGAGIVVAGGGDGTISAVAAELVRTDVPLGIIPLGTLNHFAKTLSIPLSLEEAIANIFSGETRDVDVGEVGGHVFLNNSGIGLYPRIVLDRKASGKHGRAKWLALLQATARKLLNYRLIRVSLRTSDGRRIVRATPFVLIGNNKYETSGLRIGTRIRLDGGRLWICLASEAGRLKLLALAGLAIIGRLKEPHFEVLETTELEVKTRRRRVEVAIDGEVAVLENPLRYRSIPKALRVIVPSAEKGSQGW
jgi:diacylglycerol kinase family enzyme